jgi:putative addiction module component (TIGR02574 family)
MTSQTADILNAVLSLPSAERLEIAHRILESVPPPGVLSEDDTNFAAELRRRVARYEAGQTEAAPWDVVRERIRTRLEQQSKP